MGMISLGRAAALTMALAALTAGGSLAEAKGSKRVHFHDRITSSTHTNTSNALAITAARSAGLNPRLRNLLGMVTSRFGKPVTITSGCRSRTANRRAGGAHDSLHLSCMAADIRIEGVSERALLAVARGLPGRGGVGSYCRNSIVHIDVGPRREWYVSCRGRMNFKG